MLRDMFSDSVLFVVKGADVIMRDMTSYSEWLDEDVDAIAREGLRTLVYGAKHLSYQTFNHFMVCHIISCRHWPVIDTRLIFIIQDDVI